jgi:hypothetical protein
VWVECKSEFRIMWYIHFWPYVCVTSVFGLRKSKSFRFGYVYLSQTYVSWRILYGYI